MTPSVEPLAVHRIRHPLAARHRHPAPQAGQPFVVAQPLADTTLRAQVAADRLDLVEHVFQGFRVDARMLAQRRERDTLAFEVLQNGTAQIGAIADVQHIEKRGDSDLLIARVFAFGEEEQPIEQVLDPQESPDSFIARIFV